MGLSIVQRIIAGFVLMLLLLILLMLVVAGLGAVMSSTGVVAIFIPITLVWLVLPAFGAFTGTHANALPAGARAYAIAGTRVVQVPGG